MKELDFIVGLDVQKPTLIYEIDEIQRGVKSPVDAVSKSIEMAKREKTEFNNYIEVIEESILKAEGIEKSVKRGNAGALAGIPIAVKDNIFTKGIRTTMASALFKDYYPKEDADVIKKLTEEDAIIIGKTNLHEFASGVTNVSSYFGPTRNPHDKERITGGSSGGSASSVALGSVNVALGTDTSGSIRIPSSLCGVVGFKPTYSLISNMGVFPLSWSLDTVGVIAKSVIDASFIINVLSEKKLNLGYIAEGVEPRKITLGYVNDESEISELYYSAISKLNSFGFNVKRVEFNIEEARQVHSIIRLAEASALHESRFMKYETLYSKDVAELIRLGLNIKAVDYVNALRSRKVLISEFIKLFNKVDAILTPTLTRAAPRIEEVINRELEVRREFTKYVSFVNLIGSPAISIPMGNFNSLPLGLQIISKPFEDDKLLAIAKTIEEALS